MSKHIRRTLLIILIPAFVVVIFLVCGIIWLLDPKNASGVFRDGWDTFFLKPWRES